MRNENREREAIISQAIGIASEEKRTEYLDQACGSDVELRRQVEHRIEEHFKEDDGQRSNRASERERSSREQAPARNGASHAEDRDQRIKRIGPFRVLKEIGEGPTGIVYQAEQQEPVPLKVALKLVKHGLDWRQVVARYEAEKHVLSMLEHPNIAKLYGAGTRESGQPYFVMELVEGLPLTQYCDKQQQSLQQRLEMFVSVCQAVQHAHQKGVIHGGLKPSNVLVSSEKDKAAPKILEFGVAKAVRRKLTDEDPSSTREVLGDKPEYLSPEQADPEAEDIDTRSDVYSLGVLLYELLTGTTPLTAERLKDVSMTETLRSIREEEPPAPSTRLHESTERMESVTAKMQMKKPKALIKAVSGDLDCVVKKALQKDPAQRYETVSELARDIRRYLDKEPVEACPPGTRSQLRTVARKYSRLTKVAAMILLFFFVLTLASAGLTVWAWIDEHHAKKAEEKAHQDQEKAEKSEKEAKGKQHQTEDAYKLMKKERDRARDGERTARQTEQETKAILTFFKNKLLSVGRPGDVSLSAAFWAGTKGEDVTVRKNVTLRTAADEAESQIAKEFADRPLVEASIREMLGTTYLNLGEASKAVKQYERAFTLREAVQGAKNSETAEVRNRLAVAYRLAGREPDASRLYHYSPDSPTHAAALVERGTMLLIQKKPAEAELKLREALTIREKIQRDDWITYETKSLVGEALLDQKKYEDAEPLLLSSYERMEELASRIPAKNKDRLTKALERIVRLYKEWGKLDKANLWQKQLEQAKSSKGR